MSVLASRVQWLWWPVAKRFPLLCPIRSLYARVTSQSAFGIFLSVTGSDEVILRHQTVVWLHRLALIHHTETWFPAKNQTCITLNSGPIHTETKLHFKASKAVLKMVLGVKISRIDTLVFLCRQQKCNFFLKQWCQSHTSCLNHDPRPWLMLHYSTDRIHASHSVEHTVCSTTTFIIWITSMHG